MTRAVAYLRISVEKADAITRQRAACRSLIEARGWTLTGEYVDDGVSASRSRDTAAFGQLLTDARAGQFDVVVAWAADRLVRRLSDLERLIDTGVKAATVQGGLDLTTPEGEAQASILGTFARLEGRQKSERQRAANAQGAARGEPPAGKWPFGWGPGEGDAVRQGIELVLHGASLRSVCRAWNDAGHLTTAGNQWEVTAVRKVLMNPRIAALRVYGGQTLPGAWEQLVPEETWRAAQEILANPDRRTSPASGGGRRYLLSGWATCGLCGATLTSGGTSVRGQVAANWRTQRTVRCSESWHLARVAIPVEEYVAAHVVDRLSQPDAADLLLAPGRADAREQRARVQALRTRIDGLAELVADGTLNAGSARVASGRLRDELAAAEADLADSGRVSALGPLVRAADVRAAWDALDTDRQRTAAAALMDVVVRPVGRGVRRFRPESVGITWRA